VWKGPQGPKFTDADPEAIAKALEESRKSRKKRKFTAEPKPPLAEDGVPF
jgi:ribosomal protein L10